MLSKTFILTFLVPDRPKFGLILQNQVFQKSIIINEKKIIIVVWWFYLITLALERGKYFEVICTLAWMPNMKFEYLMDTNRYHLEAPRELKDGDV